MAAAAWAWASAALAQPSGVDLAQSLNAVVFAQRSSPAPTPLLVLPTSPSTPLLPGNWKPFTFDPAYDPPGGVSSGRGAIGASTTMTLWSADGIRQRLHAMGFKDGDEVFGDKGRIYVFAAVHGQAVGMNLQGLQRAGWSTDYSSALVGDGQIGVGWRKGGFEADLGYVHRSVHLQNTPLGVSDGYADDMAALSFTFHPHW
jgi:hypothetical protein